MAISPDGFEPDLAWRRVIDHARSRDHAFDLERLVRLVGCGAMSTEL
jgi:hypothetical protein